jgi:hypothetical protein
MLGVVKLLLLLALALLGGGGCQTVPPLPAANFSQAGWTVRQGQAVWRIKKGRPEIAGEFLLATRPDGRAFAQFSKTPFPLIIAQSTTNTWEIEQPAQNKRYSGRGRPPARAIWLYLPEVLQQQQPPPKGWSLQHLPNDGWRLENPATGESIEGYFAQ